VTILSEGAKTSADPAYRVDPRLVRGAQRGDPLAISELMELLLPYVGRICGPIALQDGPDATQEAMISVMRGITSLRTPEALYGWVRVIAVREAVRVARGTAIRGPAIPAGALLDDVPARGDPLLAADIRDTLARLSPEHRAVLVLRDIEGLDESQVSQILAVPTGTVRSRLARARLGFRKAWNHD
jgi:RNA polymerase sigma factor (sigma-70 family)